MFGTEHLIWLAISFTLTGVLLFFSLKNKWKYKTAIYVMSGFAIVSELAKIFTHIKPVDGEDWASGGYLRAVSLPFHLCSIFIFVYFYLALTKNEKMIKILNAFFVPVGLVGATLALLLATSGTNFKEPYAYQCFIYHSAMLWLALYMVCSKQVRLTWKDCLRNIVILVALCITMIWINGAFITAGCDTVNFCFVVRPPADNLPFLNLDHGWFVYFIHFAITGIIMEILVTLPFNLKKRNCRND